MYYFLLKVKKTTKLKILNRNNLKIDENTYFYKNYKKKS